MKSFPTASRGRVARMGVAFALLTAGLGATAVNAPMAAASPAWSIAANPSPAGSADGQLRALTCTSGTNCFAVGQSHGAETMIERWNGTNWIVVPSPDPLRANDLTGVACTAVATCFAVGSMQDATSILIEYWNGSAWSQAAASSTGVLNGISCVGATACHAVGVRNGQSFAMRWNGAFWSSVNSPTPPGATSSALAGVDCTAASDCVAVGSAVVAGTTRTLVQRWNGTSWTVVTSPNPGGATSSRLNGVSCPLSTSCFAVGVTTVGGQPRTLIERGNGASWSVATSPNPTLGSPVLSSVDCSGGSWCVAVGSKSTYTLIEQWNGTAWSILTSPNPNAVTRRLGGVACNSATDCLAVGEADWRAMAQRWNGSAWSVQPDPVGGSQSWFEGVSCATTTDCFAVGNYLAAGVTAPWRTLAERWNGAAWTIVATPNPAGSAGDSLHDIDCLSTTFCVAVGAATISGQELTLVEQWNGATWTVVASPNVGGASNNVLSDVECTSTTMCAAVGASISGFEQQTLVEQWDGVSWTIAAGAQPGRLNGVSCATSSDCRAVGLGYNVDPEVLVVHYDGSTWSTAPGPASSSFSVLAEGSAVSCTAVDACMAVGTAQTDFPPVAQCPVVDFTAAWDGTSWQVGPTSYCALTPLDVTCTSGTDCTRVGFQKPSGTVGHKTTVILHWDGASWTGVTSPNPLFAHDSSLESVACPSPTTCFAVGGAISDGYRRTLIERYS